MNGIGNCKNKIVPTQCQLQLRAFIFIFLFSHPHSFIHSFIHCIYLSYSTVLFSRTQFPPPPLPLPHFITAMINSTTTTTHTDTSASLQMMMPMMLMLPQMFSGSGEAVIAIEEKIGRESPSRIEDSSATAASTKWCFHLDCYSPPHSAIGLLRLPELPTTADDTGAATPIRASPPACGQSYGVCRR